MTARPFKGMPSIQEVECWGAGLKPEMKLMSLKLYRNSDQSVLASLNVYSNTCLTYVDYSSCHVNSTDTHESRLRVLVSDLGEGESREYGCTALGLRTTGDAGETTWSLLVTYTREYWTVY